MVWTKDWVSSEAPGTPALELQSSVPEVTLQVVHTVKCHELCYLSCIEEKPEICWMTLPTSYSCCKENNRPSNPKQFSHSTNQRKWCQGNYHALATYPASCSLKQGTQGHGVNSPYVPSSADRFTACWMRKGLEMLIVLT